MTPIELATLRDLIVRARLASTPDRLVGFNKRGCTRKPKQKPRPRLACVYCGKRTQRHGKPTTCFLHKDLPALDPFYAEVAA